MYYEVIFEDGSHSVAEYDSDADALEANKLQHERAIAGEKGGPGGHPAARVKRILRYSEHPADLGEDKIATKAEVLDVVNSCGSLVDTDELASKIREISAPNVDSAPHDSNYKMEEEEELVLPWE